LEVHHDERRTDDVVVHNNSMLLTFEIGAQKCNSFVLLPYEVILALMF